MTASSRRNSRPLSKPTRELSIVADWMGSSPLLAQVEVPYEKLAAGPRGYRVYVVDYDASTKRFHQPAKISAPPDLDNFEFHAVNVYAVIMRTLARFEHALGRNVGWGFESGHQIHVAPHGLQGANAFYSRRDRGLFFGYFPKGRKQTFYTCLSHDVIAHETSHAILDGLRRGYYYDYLPDQAAFHEGFSDVIALLSLFSVPKVIQEVIKKHAKRGNLPEESGRIARSWLTWENLRQSALFGLGEGVGDRGAALRRSLLIRPSADLLSRRNRQESHDRGEVLVAAVMSAFLNIWLKRVTKSEGGGARDLDLDRVAEEGASAAGHLLTMAIRAIDYSPAAGIEFPDYLSALLTADYEVQIDDTKYGYREKLRTAFEQYGIKPVRTRGVERNLWEPPSGKFDYSQLHFEAMQRDGDAMFRFIWQNRHALDVYDGAYTEVRSLRPCVRISSDGFMVQETVAEYVEMLTVQARELRALGIRKPNELAPDVSVRLFGGGVLVFDEFGKVKYHVKQRVLNSERQERFLNFMHKAGSYAPESRPAARRFAKLHRSRLMGVSGLAQEAQDELF